MMSAEAYGIERGAVIRWTKTGLHCLETNADCDNCPIFKFYKLRRGAGCCQVESNQLLISRGIDPKEPEALDPSAKRDIKERKEREEAERRANMGLSKFGHSGHNSDKEKAGRKLKRRIAEILDGKASKMMTVGEIAYALEGEAFMDLLWDAKSISHHIVTMRDKGIVDIPEGVGRNAPVTLIAAMAELGQRLARQRTDFRCESTDWS
jgi:hypothetical protein